MEPAVRFIAPGELDAHIRAAFEGFHADLDEEHLSAIRVGATPDRCLIAVDDATIVGTSTSHPFTLTVPGGEAATGGVTAVTVRPTHRRRGLLRRMMRVQLDDLHERGDLLAMLWASEGGIYPRFGFGLASLNARLNADRDRMAFHESEPAGRLRPLTLEEAAGVLPSLYERVRPTRPGFVARSQRRWEAHVLADASWARRGAGPLFCGVVELGGAPEGYALYRMKSIFTQGVPDGEVHVNEAVATSPLAHRELWRFLFGVDLATSVICRRHPMDDPLPLLVTEPTRLRLSVGDGLYLRLVDVAGALGARGYAAPGELTLDVLDEFCPWNAGCWRLAVADGRASVSPGREPELRLTAADLACVYLGGFTFSELARALRVEELVPGALARADVLFRTERAPFCPEGF